MLDISAAYASGGSASLVTFTTAATNDKHAVTNAGFSPFRNGSTLVAWGAQTITADDEITEIKLIQQDELDTVNYSDWAPGGTPTTILSPLFMGNIKSDNPRALQYKQADADKIEGYVIDHYPSSVAQLPPVMGTRVPMGNFYPITLSANTAGAWTSSTWAPSNNPPVGKYAILGAYGSAITTGALLGFEHASFGNLRPGFPITDCTQGTLTLANVSFDPIYTRDNGFQFVAMSERTGQPQCPVFEMQKSSSGTGLVIYSTDVNASTPVIILNLQRLA